MKEKKGIAGSTLKLIALVTMLIDHIGATLVERTMYANGYLEAMADQTKAVEWMTNPANLGLYFLDIAMRMIGRIAFPIFIFLLVQGFMHTHSKAKYLLRMAIFCIIAEIPFNLAINCTLTTPYYQSVFFTLTIGLLVIWGMDTLKGKTYEGILPKILKYVSFFCFGAFFFYLFMQTILGGIVIPLIPNVVWNTFVQPFGLDMYVPSTSFLAICGVCGVISLIIFSIVTAKKEENAVIAEALMWFPVYAGILAGDFLMTDYSGFGVLAIVMAYIFRNKNVKSILMAVITLTISNPIEAVAFLDLLFVKNYNGKRGLSLKYIFYIFYPAHLLILYLIGHFALGVM